MMNSSPQIMFIRKFTLFVSFILISITAFSQEQSAEELAIKFANPIASLISVPLQNATDYGIGKDNGSRNTLNVQPVVPITLSPKLNLITRYIVPIITQYNITGNGTMQSGVSDALVSGFFSPSEVKKGFTWGVGPVFSLPTSTNSAFGSNQFGVGPTIVALQQAKGWTYGLLANQIWSNDNDANTMNMNQAYFQPFLSYNFKSGASIGGNNEIATNWNTNTTSAFLHLYLNGVTKIGSQSVLVGGGPRICYASPESSKPDFGMRFLLVFLFPR